MKIVSLFAQAAPYYSNDMHSSNVSDAAAAGFQAVMILFTCLFVAIVYIATAFLLGRIFKKAGEKSWKAWVPIYNSWVLLELGDQKGFWSILLLLPIINIVAAVFMYIAYYRIGLKFGKEGAFVLLAIFLPIVWMIWLAIDNSTWKDEKQSSPHTSPHQA
jgi:hypothetical protein